MTASEKSITSLRAVKERMPFNNQLAEAAAIDAKVSVWAMKCQYSKLNSKRRTRLELLISGGMKAAAQLRFSQQ